MAATDISTLATEYETLTERCGLVDRSERGKLALTGPGAVEFLNGQVTNELIGLKPGDGRYAAFLTHKGKMLGDLRILAVGENGGDLGGERSGEAVSELLLDTERSALQVLFDMIRRFKVGYEVELHKRTIECSLLSLIGPGAEEIAAKAFTADPTSRGLSPDDLPEHENSHVLVRTACAPVHAGVPAHAEAPVHPSAPIRLIRTDVGIDVLLDSSATDAARAALQAAGAVEVSEAAAEIVRVEHGRPRYGLDMDEGTIPQEAGLNERAVSFTKGCYVGQETVARLHYKGKPNRHLRGLRLSEPAEPGAELRIGERSVGHLGSSVISPRMGPIGLALVRREAEPGMTVTVGERGTTGSASASAVVTELPFA